MAAEAALCPYKSAWSLTAQEPSVKEKSQIFQREWEKEDWAGRSDSKHTDTASGIGQRVAGQETAGNNQL